MKEVKWQMQEHFSFPSHLGKVKEVSTFTVTPQWDKEELIDSVRLTGIYHITASVQFEQGECEQVGIFIEDVDLDAQLAYFEYALPLEIDLPKAQYKELTVNIVDTNATAHKTGGAEFVWDVQCNLLKTEPVVVAVAVEPISEKVSEPIAVAVAVEPVSVETAVAVVKDELDFFEELPDQFSSAILLSNKVRP